MRTFVLLTVLTCSAYSQTYYMNIRQRGGGTESIALQDIRKLVFDLGTSVEHRDPTAVTTFVLLQNYPNPFNPSTTIGYELPKLGTVEIRIFCVTGQLVRSFDPILQTAGMHTMIWDGLNNSGQSVATGMYIYQILFENSMLAKKMLLLR